MTKENIRHLAVELSKARQKKKNLVKGKGKHILLLQEEFDDEYELHARAAEILEDALKSISRRRIQKVCHRRSNTPSRKEGKIFYSS